MITTAERILFCKASNLTEFLSWFAAKEWDFDCLPLGVMTHASPLWEGGEGVEAHNPGKLWKNIAA